MRSVEKICEKPSFSLKKKNNCIQSLVGVNDPLNKTCTGRGPDLAYIGHIKHNDISVIIFS